jgi:outer membrane immunogenic protein
MKWGEVIGGAALAALAGMSATGPARAADMTPVARPAPPSTYIPAQFYWTGFYMGAGLGDGWGTSAFVDPLNAGSASPSIKGLLVTGVIGINYQFSTVVVGAEGDFTGAYVNGSATDTGLNVPPTSNSLQTKVFWTASITGRLGWAIDRLLIYGKGGVAFDYDRNTVTISNGAGVLGTFNHVGWTVGGGAEYAVTEHWTARLEYDYLKFASRAFPFSGPAGPGIGAAPTGTVGINLNEIKGIMAYKF